MIDISNIGKPVKASLLTMGILKEALARKKLSFSQEDITLAAVD